MKLVQNPIITTNILFVLPSFLAWWYGEYMYALYATGVLVHSVAYHTLAEYNRSHRLYIMARTGDWFFALLSFAYMLHYAFSRMDMITALWEIALLLLCFSYFAYGMSAVSRYRATHPVFHVLIAIVGTLILVMGVAY